MENVQIVILAAGKSKRMGGDEPKALASLKGKAFLAHILDTIKSLNFPLPPIVIVGHKKERIFEVFGTENITHKYAEQKEQLGTGHALAQSKNHLDENHKTIMVISTDQPLISSETILSILENHKKNNNTITLGTLVLPDFEGWHQGLFHFGRIIRDAYGKVLRNVEYKDADDLEKQIKEVNPAMYAFDSFWLWENIDKLQNENMQGEYYLTDLIALAVNQNKNVEAVPLVNILEGIQPNTPEELNILENLLK